MKYFRKPITNILEVILLQNKEKEDDAIKSEQKEEKKFWSHLDSATNNSGFTEQKVLFFAF